MAMSIRARSLIMLLAASSVAVVGCGGGVGVTEVPATEVPASAAIGSPAPGSAVPGSPVPGSFPPATPFAFGSSAAEITTASAGLPDERYVNPGAVVAAADGTLHLFANVFTAWPGPVQVVHLTSHDATHWTRVGPVDALSSQRLPFADPGSDVSAGVVLADGTWVLILESVAGTRPWELYEATAPGPDGPWSVGSVPILAAGPQGSIDAGGLRWPAIVAGGPGYLLYYGAAPAGGASVVIAVATSIDGHTWQRLPDPILVPDRSFEGISVDRPRVAATSSGFLMIYSGNPITNRGEAVSTDGLTWTKVGDGPVISRDRFPLDGNSWDAALFRVGDRLEYLLEIGMDGGHTAVFAAATP